MLSSALRERIIKAAQAAYQLSDHPVIMDQQLFNLFGPNYYEWLPETLAIEMTRMGYDREANKEVFSMAHAIQIAVGNILPYEDWFAFEKVGWGLTGYEPDFELFQPLTLPQVYVVVDILALWSDRDDWDRTKEGLGLESLFNDEVWTYIAALFIHEKIPFVPPPYAHLQKLVTRHLHVSPELYEQDYYGGGEYPQTLLLKGCETAVERSRERQIEESARLETIGALAKFGPGTSRPTSSERAKAQEPGAEKAEQGQKPQYEQEAQNVPAAASQTS